MSVMLRTVLLLACSKRVHDLRLVRPRLDYLWAALCLLGAVYFIFRAPA